MISVTHLVFGLSIAYILDKRLLTASIFALVPDFDVTFNFLYPFVHRGIMHSLLAAGIFTLLVFLYTEDRGSAESCLLGYSSHLVLDSLTSSGVPILFPFFRGFSLSLSSAYSLKSNLAIIVFSASLVILKEHSKVFERLKAIA